MTDTSARLGVALLGLATLGESDMPDYSQDRFEWEGHCWELVTDPDMDTALVRPGGSVAAQEQFAARLANILKLNVGNLTVTEGATINEAVISKLWADGLEAQTIASSSLIVTAEAILNHATLIGKTVVDDINVQGKLIGTNGVFTGMVDFVNINVTGQQIVNTIAANSIDANRIKGGSFEGQTFTGGTFTGARINAVGSDGTGLILEPQTSYANSAMFFSDDGSLSSGQAAIWRLGYAKGVASELMLRGAHGADVRVQDSLYVNQVMKAQSIESRANLQVDGHGTIDRNLTVGGGRDGARGGIFAPKVDVAEIQMRDEMTVDGTGKIVNYGGLSQHGSSVYFRNLPSGSSSGNVIVDNKSRRMHQNFSSRRFKKNIADWNPEAKRVLGLQPRQWQHHDPAQPDNPNNLSELWHVGFIAEEVDELGLYGLVNYGGDGRGGWRPDSLNYDRFCAAQQIVLKKHEQEISELLDRIALLESKD